MKNPTIVPVTEINNVTTVPFKNVCQLFWIKNATHPKNERDVSFGWFCIAFSIICCRTLGVRSSSRILLTFSSSSVFPSFIPTATFTSSVSYLNPSFLSNEMNFKLGFENWAAIAPGLSEIYPSIFPEFKATIIAGKLSIAVCFFTPFIWSITS